MVAWWCMILGAGFAVGGITAATHESVRVFTKTLGVPLVLLLLRTFVPARFHGANDPLPILLEYVVLAFAAFVGDYLVGLLVGKSDAKGFREEIIGH